MKLTVDEFPLLLCEPGVDGIPAEHTLPLSEEAYEVKQQGDFWKVLIRATGELIYAGPGPVRIRRSAAPF